MPYLPPDGFAPYPGSHLYYRSENGADPQTGSPCQWVTYFDPNAGTYHQVAYPLPEQPPPVKPKEPSAPQPEPPTFPPQAAPQPSREPPSPPTVSSTPKKGRGRPVALLLVLILLLGGGFALWYTGAYTKLPFFASNASIGTPSSGPSAAPQSLPEQGTPQRAALLALAQLFSEQGIHENFMGLGTQELKIALVDYDLRAATEVSDDLADMWKTLLYSTDSLPIENSYVDLSYSLITCAMQADISTRLVEERGDRAVVELTGRGRLDLDRVGDWLTGMDYGAPYDAYLKDAFGMVRADLSGYYEEGWPKFFLGYWGQALESHWQEDLRAPEDYTVEVTLIREDGGDWLLESVPADLPLLLYAYTALPLDLDAPFYEAMSALGAEAEPTAAAPETLMPGTYAITIPDYGQVVSLMVFGDGEFELAVWLGGTDYMAYGTWDYRDGVLTLAAAPDSYYRDLIGDLSAVKLRLAEVGRLTLDAPAPLGLLEPGESLTHMGDYSEAPPPVPGLLYDAMMEYLPYEEWAALGEQYPSLSAFPTGGFLREDGNALLVVDGSEDPDYMKYALCALPGVYSGSKAEMYVTPSGGERGSPESAASVFGRTAEDGDTHHSFTLLDSGAIQVSTDWPEAWYIAYEATDGVYWPLA